MTENAEIGSFVVKITSNDLDVGQNANVTYSLSENPGRKFAIDKISGNVTVADWLDREEQDEYLLKVVARDGAWAPMTTLTITIQDQNDNPPEFEKESYNFHFPELQPKMSYVGLVEAFDRDKQGPNSVISYAFKQPSDLFTIDPATGDIYCKKIVKYHRPFSPENTYSLTVIATDNGKPPMSAKVSVFVNIVDANNNAPVFDQKSYLSPVPENYQVGKHVIQLSARDEVDFGVNAKIEYSLVGGNGTEFFAVEPESGWIFVNKTLVEFSVGTVFNLRAVAKDLGVPSQTDEAPVTLVVSGENRFTPVFAAVSYQVRVPENEPVNTTILTVNAADGDTGPNGMVRYRISSGNSKFTVHPVTGAVTILEPLDFDTVPEYRLNITATDLGFESKYSVATLTVNVSDINDNPPTFNQTLYEAYLAENSPAEEFYKLQAKDVDSSKFAVIQYQIIGGSGKDQFSIDRDSGSISSKRSFDFEEKNEYTLEIEASNPDSNPKMFGVTTVLVHITGVNEFYPKFIQPVFDMDVSESAEVGTPVGTVQATDQDSGNDGKVRKIVFCYLNCCLSVFFTMLM